VGTVDGPRPVRRGHQQTGGHGAHRGRATPRSARVRRVRSRHRRRAAAGCTLNGRRTAGHAATTFALTRSLGTVTTSRPIIIRRTVSKRF
jgi:hypothetical protein